MSLKSRLSPCIVDNDRLNMYVDDYYVGCIRAVNDKLGKKCLSYEPEVDLLTHIGVYRNVDEEKKSRLLPESIGYTRIDFLDDNNEFIGFARILESSCTDYSSIVEVNIPTVEVVPSVKDRRRNE